MTIYDIYVAILKKLRRFREFERVIIVDVNPDIKIPSKLLVLVGEKHHKWLRFKCPCGCGQEQLIPLAKNVHPHWRVSVESDSTLTVYPSIQVETKRCKAHFWIIKNKVIWAKE